MDLSTLHPVSVTCPCPGTPHADGDTVYLLPKMGLQGGITAEHQILSFGGDQSALVGALTETFVRFGVVAWTFVDANGKPVPCTDEKRQELLLTDYTLARDIGDKADELYSAAVIDPLACRLSNGSGRPSRDRSTSPKRRSASKRPKPLQPSSTTTSPMAATTTTTA